MAYAYSNIRRRLLPPDNGLKFFLYSKDDYSFPEFLYNPSNHNYDEYIHKVQLGFDRMYSSTAVFAGTCRNIGHLVSRVKARLEYLGDLFKDYRVVIYESDSTDDTTSQLLKWQEDNPRVHIIHETLNLPRLHDTSLERREHMAYYRNHYLRYIQKKYSDFSYSLIFDLDLLGGWSYHGIANTIGHDGWSAVGSNGLWYNYNDNRIAIYYDSWALRTNDQTPLKRGERITISTNGVACVENMMRYRGEQLNPVDSAFNGLAIYRTEVLKGKEYRADDCDHPTLHEQIRSEGGKIFMNPSQITLYNYPHFYELNA